MEPLAPPPDLVLFDLDDTLCDYAGARRTRLRIAFTLAYEQAGLDPVDDLDTVIDESIRVQPHGSDHFAALLARQGIHDPHAVTLAREWYRENRFHSLALFHDAVETLASVREARPNRVIGMITNGPAEVQAAKIDLLELRDQVDFILISGEFGVEKPEEPIFREALRLGRASAAEAAFIGDSPAHDVAGARRTGIRAVWVNRSRLPWPAGEDPPDYEVRDLAAVRRLLGRP